MIEAIIYGEIMKYMPFRLSHRHLTPKQARLRFQIIEKAKNLEVSVEELGSLYKFWNRVYSRKIGTCKECSEIYEKYKILSNYT